MRQNYSKSRPQDGRLLRSVQLVFLSMFIMGVCAIQPEAVAGTYSSGLRKIIIDAGHGGRDPGNLGTGRYSKTEKNIALEVALLTGKLIKENIPGVEVIHTRTNDKTVKLHERTALANREKADLFISIHCDAFTSSAAVGSTSIVMGKDHGDENMRVAQQENSVIFLEEDYEENYEGFDPSRPETYIALTLYQNHFQYQSIALGQKIQTEFSEYAKRKDRGVKQQPLWVTSRAAMPAVLVELGFLTNHGEEDFLNSSSGKEKMAESIFRAVRAYKQEVDELESANQVEEEAIKEKLAEQTAAAKEKEEMPAVDFRVQVRTSSKEITLSDPFFQEQASVAVYRSGDLFKYTIGQYYTYEEARDRALELRQKGFDGAFVVAFKEGERIDIQEAKAATR